MPSKLFLSDDLAHQVAQEQDITAKKDALQFEQETVAASKRSWSSALQYGLNWGYDWTLDQAALDKATVELYGDNETVLTDEDVKARGLEHIQGPITEAQAEILTRREENTEQALAHIKDGWFSASLVGIGALASVFFSPTSVVTAGVVGAAVNSTRFARAIYQLSKYGESMKGALSATKAANAVSRTSAGKTLVAAGATTKTIYGKSLGKILDSKSAAHGLVNVGELAAVDAIEEDIGIETNIAPFVPLVFLAPGVLTAMGRVLKKSDDAATRVAKMEIDADGSLTRQLATTTDPIDSATPLARRPSAPTVSQISDQAPYPQAAFLKASGVQDELKQSVEFFARAGYDYPMASIFRWTNDVDELNRIVKSAFPEAPDMVDVKMANKFIRAVEGDDRWGQLWSRLTSLQADTIKAMHVNKLGRANKRVPKDTDFIDERPPAKLGDDLHTQAAQRGLVDIVHQTGVVGRKAKSAKEALQEYDDAVRAASTKAEKELKAKEAAEEAAKQKATPETTKKPAAKEKPPVTLEDLAKSSEDAINAFVKCVKG